MWQEQVTLVRWSSELGNNALPPSPPQPAGPPSRAANYGLRAGPRPPSDIGGTHLGFTFSILIISALSSWLPPRPVWK